MRYVLRPYSVWEIGQRVDAAGNPHQEDSIFPQAGCQTDDDRLFILCDGMGGHSAGEVASATVCEALSSNILGNTEADGIFTEADFASALSAAYDALDANDNGATKKMGTTLALLKLHSGGYFVAHIGDSRVYHFRPGKTAKDTKIMFRTEDHSLVNALLKVGELTPEEAKTFKRKNVITRAMQPNGDRRAKADIYQSADIQAGDYFLLCSDGILEQMDDDDLRQIFSKAGGNDKNKVEKALREGTVNNRDNHSAIVVHIYDVDHEEQSADHPTVVMPQACGTCRPTETIVHPSPAPKKKRSADHSTVVMPETCRACDTTTPIEPQTTPAPKKKMSLWEKIKSKLSGKKNRP